MQIYKCFVSRAEYGRVKDVRDVVLTKLNKKLWKENPDLSLGQIERKLAQMIRERHQNSDGLKSVLTILQEINSELGKEGY